MENNSKKRKNMKINRRDFLSGVPRVAAAFSMFGLLETLEGCGSGGGGGGSIGATRLSGSVNLNEIGGAGLTVISAHQASAPVATDGSFTTQVSNSNPQLLILVDNSGAVRSLSIWNPTGKASSHAIQQGMFRSTSTDTEESNDSHLSGIKYPVGSVSRQGFFSGLFSAASTATALLMNVPGILTTSASEISSRVLSVQTMNSFNPLVTYLGALANSSLTALANESNTLTNLITSGVNEWMSSHNPYTPNPFSAQITGQTGSVLSVNLTNSGWQFANVARQMVDFNGQQLGSLTYLTFPKDDILTLDAMKGADNLTWGSLFTGQAFAAHDYSDSVDISLTPGAAAINYWMRGVGAKGINGTPPTFNPPNDKYYDAVGLTLVYYIILPTIDLIGGLGLKGSGKTVEAALAYWDAISADVQKAGTLDTVIAAVESGSVSSLVQIALNLVSSWLCAVIETVVPALVALGIVTSETGVGPITAVALIAALEAYCGIKIALAAADILIAATAWIDYPSITSANIAIPGVGGALRVNLE